MRTVVLTSTPLRPLAQTMRRLAITAAEFWAATAFLSREIVDGILAPGLNEGARIRLLTGTFGRQTRRQTFKRVLELTRKNPALLARIWHCGRHGDFHAKVYLWRLRGGEGVAWIGSPNLTPGGLRAEGELVLQIRERWSGPVLTRLRRAFEREWNLGTPLSAAFVARYREAKRTAPDLRIMPSRRGRGRQATGTGRALVLSIKHHYAEDSRVAKRVDALFGRNFDDWVRHRQKTLSRVRNDTRCLVVDVLDRTVTLGQVVDTGRDGRFRVFAYDYLLPRDGYAPWNRRTVSALARSGLFLPYPQGPRLMWVDEEVMTRAERELRKQL